MKKALLALAFMVGAMAAQAAPVMSDMSRNTNTLYGIDTGLLTLDKGYDFTLDLSATSKNKNDLSFSSLVIRTLLGQTLYSWNPTESFSGNSTYHMDWDTPALSLGAGIYWVTLEWWDTKTNGLGNASSYSLDMGPYSAWAPPAANVPEPGTLALMGSGLMLLWYTKRRQQRGVSIAR